MALKETLKSMHKYLECIAKDLKKAEKGNKAASQRVRTCTIKLAKVSKTFRKESVSEERKTTKRKTTKKTAKRSTKRKTTKRKKRR
ncbi:MAG: Histone H1-like protein HC1 [Candidatus Anoxychlamydiales bacterium]|nr:Histone H1-like protein HC1 [Candidatus Anoxychlamydiales bacterium]NGX41586.1 Histone H1-like protein HC1 [Candidatus Anoxychlamydiales bacterium]